MTTEQMETQTVTEVEKLKGHLGHYRRCSDEIADLEQKCGQAKADKAAALSDHSANEADIMKKVSEAKTHFEVYSDRLEGKRLMLGNLLNILEGATVTAGNELGNTCSAEKDRRWAILVERILKVIGLPDDGFKPRGLIELVRMSPWIIAIEQCEPTRNVFSPLSIEQKAVELLAKFAKLETEKDKVI